MLLSVVSLLFTIRLGGFGFECFQIKACFLRPIHDHFMGFTEYRFQPAPELCVIDVMDFGIVRDVRGPLGGIHETSRGKWATFTPTVAIVVNARDEITVRRELSQFILIHSVLQTSYFEIPWLCERERPRESLQPQRKLLIKSGHCNVLLASLP